MRPLLRPATTWARPLLLPLPASQQAVLQAVFGTATPTTDQCLALWDDDSSQARTLGSDERTALAAIRDGITPQYKLATPYVLDAFGSYCAYCELPLHDPIQVEHVLPKAEYPTFSLDWENFLPACIGCNSRKRDKPLRTDVATKLNQHPCPPAACEAYIRTQLYRWPDRDAVDGFFGAELWYDDPGGGGWTPCPPADSVDPSVSRRSDSVVSGQVRADLPGLPDVSVHVLVADETAGADARTAALIELCALARPIFPGDSADRRTWFRTLAWLKAVETLRPLFGGGLPSQLPGIYADLVVATGFYWVWLTVAQRIDPTGGLLTLVRDATAPLLDGTDATRLP